LLSSTDYATVKYDVDGNQLWVARFNGPADAQDTASALAVDADGSVYVTGSSTGLLSSTDYATVKYDADGNQLWVARFNGPADAQDTASALAVDADGNVYVTGYSGISFSNFDYVTIKSLQSSNGGGGGGGGGNDSDRIKNNGICFIDAISY
jgi:hypothetical protein